MPAGACGNLSALLPLAGIVLVAAPALPAPAGPDAPAIAAPRHHYSVVAPRDRVPPVADRLAAAASPSASRVDGGDAPPDAAIATLDTVVLRVDGLDADVLRAALARRRPDLSLRAPADAPADASRAAYVEVVAALPAIRLDVVLGDGRAYRRELDTGGAPGERSAARMLVQLLAAIAEQRAEPERRDAPIPAWVGADARSPDAPAAVPEPAIPEPAIPEPTAVVPAPTRPADPPDPVPAPRVEPTPPARPPPDPVVAPRRALELGLAGDFTALLGLSPPRDVSPLRGLGGGLRLDLAWPRALVIGLGVRALQRRADDLALTRLRGAATVGWLARRGRFEALLSAGLSFETWRLRQQGEPVHYAEPGADTRPLLIGGLVRAAPGARLTTRGRVAFRLGAWLELAGSVLPTGAAARLSRIDHDGRPPAPTFAAGGLELALGLELAVWISLRRPRA